MRLGLQCLRISIKLGYNFGLVVAIMAVTAMHLQLQSVASINQLF